MNETFEAEPMVRLTSTTVYNTIGVTMSVLFVLALIENISVLIVNKANPKLHDKTNIWVVAVLICDLLIVINAFPYVILTSFYKRNIFGDLGCNWDGFIVTVLGTSSIFLLTGLSVHRYLIMLFTAKAESLTRTKTTLGVLVCISLGIFWGLSPMLGWGSFALEGIGLSCAPNWRSPAKRDRTYMIAMYICVLFLPLIVIGFCYTRILLKIWREKRNHSAWLQQRRVKRDIKVTISVAFTILSFIVSWTPYAVVSLLEGFFQIDIQSISPLLVQLPCLMAKTSCIWNPIVYVCLNTRYRKAYVQTFGCLKKFIKRGSDTEDKSNSTES